MKLYYSPGACSLVPHILVLELDLSVTLVKVDTGSHRTERGDDYNQINPKGAVPLLELDNGEHLSEGPVIAQYLCDWVRDRNAAAATLMPAPGSLARYRVMEWQNYITSELHKSFTPLFRASLNDEGKQVFRDSLRHKFEWVSQVLAKQDYLCGKDFTAADAYLFTVSNWAPYVGLDLSDLKALQDYRARIQARPSVQQAMHEEGLLN